MSLVILGEGEWRRWLEGLVRLVVTVKGSMTWFKADLTRRVVISKILGGRTPTALDHEDHERVGT